MADNTTEKIMAVIMDRLAEQFGNHAILKGGMELRLLDCPRSTNDLDYIFIPYSSKNEIKDAILSSLQEIPDAMVAVSLHSTCVRYIVSRNDVNVQIEINVAPECSSEAISTGTFATSHNLQPRIIRVMRLDCALAHKLAAWNERHLIRDLYDASFMKNILGIFPAVDILRHRLTSIKQRRKTGAGKLSMSLSEFAEKLANASLTLKQQAIETELRDYFEPGMLPGLSLKIKTGLGDIVDFLRREGSTASTTTPLPL